MLCKILGTKEIGFLAIVRSSESEQYIQIMLKPAVKLHDRISTIAAGEGRTCSAEFFDVWQNVAQMK